MRLSTNMIYSMSSQSVLQRQSDLAHVRQQLASGKKILSPADAPRDASQALVVSQSLAVNEQYAATRDIAKRHLSSQVTQLKSITNALNAAKPLLVQAGNGTLNDSDLNAVATELEGVYEQLMDSANAKDGNGRYLFSGFKIHSPAMTGAQGNVVFNGDGGHLNLQVNGHRTMQVSHTARDIFSSVTQGGSYVAKAVPGKVAGAAEYHDLHVLDPSDPEIVAGDDFRVDFTDVVDNGDGTYDIKYDVKNTVDAPATSTSATITDYDPSSDKPFTIKMGAQGGLSLSFVGLPDADDSFTITQGSKLAYGVDSSADNTGSGKLSYDMIDGSLNDADIADRHSYEVEITDAGSPGKYQFTDLTSGFVSEEMTITGSKLEIGDKGALHLTLTGTPNVGDTFNVVPDSEEHNNILNTLAGVIKDLKAGTKTPHDQAMLHNTLNSALRNLSNSLDNVSTIQSQVGSSINELDSLDTVGNNRSLNYKTTISGLTDLNYAKAASDYALNMVGLQMAQKTFQDIQQLSMFNIG